MLPRASRLNVSGDFRSTIRHGVRVGRPTLVLHVGPSGRGAGVRVGMVVSKTVGNAVVRNRVKRRLRAQMSHRIDQLPDGGRLVVRALPGSTDLDSGTLARDLDRALAGATRRLQGRSTRPPASRR